VPESTGQWIKGCAVGCGVFGLGLALLIVGMTFSLRSAFDDAHADRRVLEDRFGAVDAYTPPVDGTVDPDRMEAFLAVREGMADVHREIEAVDREMGDFEQLAATDEEPPMRVALPAVARLTRSMLGLPWVFGEVERTRNRGLVDAGMGLGEYSYIYLVAYHHQEVAPDEEAHLFGETAINSRVRAELIEMLVRQLQSAEAELAADDEWLRQLRSEVAALEADQSRLPWQGGLPDRIQASVGPYRERLDAVYSASAAEFELLSSTVHGGGLRIEMK
jgi:hypothetical protein